MKIISVSFLMIFSFSLLVTASLAWLANFTVPHYEQQFQGSSIASYFAEGKGTEEEPYVINEARHLYNLAWLQNQQPPVFSETTHFLVCKSLDDRSAITLDMAGKISGMEATGGAIPPIGTNASPFIGHFDGCGSVIQNLWISTNKNDWKEQPNSTEEYVSTHVGMFGAVSDEAIVTNFILDRVEVTVNIDSTVGIICGYVDAMLYDVGVYNGILNIEEDTTCFSAYSLLGEITNRIVWEDMPAVKPGYGSYDRSGGDLIIDPNNYDGLGEAFTGLDTGTKKVPNSISGTAYFSASLGVIGGNISTKAIYDLRKYHETGNKKDAVQFTESNIDSTRSLQKIWSMYKEYQQDDTLITITKPFTSNDTAVGTVTTKDIENKDIVIPANCIWFKPQNAGKVGMVFAATNQNSSRFAMLYICKRTGDTLTPVKKVEYVLPVSQEHGKIIKNGQLVYYEYEITDNEYKEGYEYVIGASNVSGHDAGSFGFFALMLAGTDVTGGNGSNGGEGEEDEFIPKIYDVDYVVSTDIDITDTNYENHKALLQITKFEATEEKKLYYLAKTVTDNADFDSIVYYFPDGVSMVDIAVGQQSATSSTGFLDRDEIGN